MTADQLNVLANSADAGYLNLDGADNDDGGVFTGGHDSLPPGHIRQAARVSDVPDFSVFSHNIRGTGVSNRGYQTGGGPLNEADRFCEAEFHVSKLAELYDALGKREIPPNTYHDIGLIQEFRTVISPQVILRTRFVEYSTFAGPPHVAGGHYDTVVLVKKSFGKAQLEVEVSCERATFITIPDFGLLVVSIHGAFDDIRAFHQDVISKVARYKEAGWTPIVGGDFNIAPTAADRRSPIWCNEQEVMSLYTETLELSNVCEVLEDLANPSPTTDRSTFFTFRRKNRGKYVYVSRIDHILVPPHLLDVGRASYDDIDVETDFSDHKRITVYLPQTPPGEFFSVPFCMSHDFLADPVHLAKIEQILCEFDFSLTGVAAFEKYKKLLGNILKYARNQNKRQQSDFEHKINSLRKNRARLGNEHRGKGWSICQNEIRDFEEQAIALTKRTSITVQERVAASWLKNRDCDSFWRTLVNKRQFHPRCKQVIAALEHCLPAGLSTVNRDSGTVHPSGSSSQHPSAQRPARAEVPRGPILSNAAGVREAIEYYFGAKYAHDEPLPESLRRLLDSLEHRIRERGCNITDAERAAMSSVFELVDIAIACSKAKRLKAAGPNGIPAELYIQSETAQKILCHLGNIWLSDPASVPAFFAEGSIVLHHEKGDRTLLDNYRSISILNADLKILTSIVAERIGNLVSRAVAPEQFAVIPGRHMVDGIYKVQAAAKHLELSESQGAMVFLDQEKAVEQISHTALFAVLARIGIPANYVAAIKALYSISPSRVLVNGKPSGVIPIRRGVRQGDALSRILFAIAVELLGCAICENLPPAARLVIPGADCSHVQYMDETVVMLSSLKYWPSLERGLKVYCEATTASCNITNAKIVPFCHKTCEIPSNLPVTPVAEGVPVHFIGAMIGWNVQPSTRKALLDELMFKTISAGRQAVQAHGTIEGRAYAIKTFILPRFAFVFQFEDFTLGQIAHANAMLQQILWKPITPFLEPALVAQPAHMGGYGMPTLGAAFRAAKLEIMARFAAHVRRITNIDPPQTARCPIPEWPAMLLELWQYHIFSRARYTPKSLHDLVSSYSTQLFYDPLVQHVGFAHAAGKVWPPTWNDAYKVLHSKAGIKSDENINLLREVACRPGGNALARPLLMTGHFKAIGPRMWNLLALALQYMIEEQGYSGLVTVSTIPVLVQILQSSDFKGTSKSARQKLADELNIYHQSVTTVTANLSGPAATRSYQYNMAFGTAAQAENDKAHSFEEWSCMRTTCEFIEHNPERLVFPQFNVRNPALTTGSGLLRPSWLSITRLNALSDARSTIHRLALDRLPARTLPECDCGGLDSVKHMLGECPFLGEFRSQFFARWMSIAHKIVRIVVREENALSDSENAAHPLARPRPRISVAILRLQLPRNAPQLENWLALPFLRWSAFCDLKTPTAMHFNQCYELAASLFIHFRYVARNSLAYMQERWSADQFATSFNRKFQQLANATIDHNLADPANVRDRDVLDQLLSSSANLDISSDRQRPPGLNSGSCNEQSRTGKPPFAHFILLALLENSLAGHSPCEAIPAAIDSGQVEDTQSQTSDTPLMDLI